jgi:hypothetical protein
LLGLFLAGGLRGIATGLTIKSSNHRARGIVQLSCLRIV